MRQYSKFLIIILFLSFIFIDKLFANSFPYRREYDNYKSSLFRYYFGVGISYNNFDYKSKEAKYKFGDNLFAGELLLGTKIDNILNIEVFYKKSPYHTGSVVNSTSPYNLLNNFYSFGFELLPQVELNKYFDLLFAFGVTKHEIRSVSFNNILKSNGNGIKFGLGMSTHLNGNADLRILCNQVIFTGYDAMSSNFYPSLSLVINF